VRPQLERLVPQLRELDLLTAGESMALPDGNSQDLPADGSLAQVVGIRGQGREREITAALTEQRLDVAAEHFPGLDLEQPIVLGQASEQHRHRLEGADERIHEAQDAGFAAGGRLHPSGGSVGAGEHAPAIGEEDLPFGRESDPPRAALEQRDTEQLLERLDLLAHRLLCDVQLLRGSCEAAAFGNGREIPHLAQVRSGHGA
jgi:hypothetical protein